MHNNKIDKNKFEFTSVDEKIFDAKFEGKPRSFLKDAMIRFLKNKINVVATAIVALVILLSLTVPVLTTKDYQSAMIPSSTYLPPRVPFLEKFGIFDGTVKIKDYQVDLNNYELIDESLGDTEDNRLYYPVGSVYPSEFIKEGTLTNKKFVGGIKNEFYIGGTNNIKLDKFKGNIVAYNEKPKDTLTNINISIDSIDNGGKLTVYVKPSNLSSILPPNVSSNDEESFNYYEKLGEITTSGDFSFENNSNVEGEVYFVFRSENPDVIRINNVEMSFAGGEVVYADGYKLSQFATISMKNYGGFWERENAVYTVASFKYYKYNEIYFDYEQTLPSSEYEKLLNNNPGMRESIVYNDPNDHSKGWKFGDGNYLLKEVIRKTAPQEGPNGEQFFSYIVVRNGKLNSQYSELPYFLFGTDGKGRDLFASVWASLRTSLVLGLIVSAINIIIGVIWGSISGYFGGKIDFGMERFVEVLSSFPGLTVLTILYLQYGAGFSLLLLYLTYSGWIGVAGLTRIQFYRYRGREYVLASRTLGASHGRLIFKHILPNSLGYIVTSVVLSVPSMILTEASLSFLGFGLGEGSVLDLGIFKLSGLSLGILLYNGEQNMTVPGRFYMVMIPAIIIIIIMIAFNLFGNALRDAMNPSLRGNEE
jgi:oligopeptide transport system permease protein